MLFDELIERRRRTAINAPPTPTSNNNNDVFVPYEDDGEKPRLILELDNPVDENNKAMNVHPAYDQLIHM